MAETTGIEWCDHTFNPWRGCTKVIAGCANCYAETLGARNPKVLGDWGLNGSRVVAAESYWKLPEKWNRQAQAAGVRKRVFCASLADVFEDWKGPMADAKGFALFPSNSGGWRNRGTVNETPLSMAEVRQRLFHVIGQTPYLDWLLLTKRPELAIENWPLWAGYWASSYCKTGDHDTAARIARDYVLPNVWLGVSVENQATADERIPLLLQVPAAVRFLSVEPLLGPVDLVWWLGDRSENLPEPRIHWVIAGGESGPKARPCNVAWIRSIVQQCKAAGVACFVKQDSGRLPGHQGTIPDDLWSIKEFPDALQRP